MARLFLWISSPFVRRARMVGDDARADRHAARDRDAVDRPYAGHPYQDDPYVDVVLATDWTDLTAYDLYGRWSVYATAKRQLSRAEITKLGLPRVVTAAPP
jgi:hypothetical protein